jgi:hypothetical protein
MFEPTGACCVKCIADTNKADECVPNLTELECDALNFGQLHEWLEGGECSELQVCDDSCYMQPVPAVTDVGLCLLFVVLMAGAWRFLR